MTRVLAFTLMSVLLVSGCNQSRTPETAQKSVNLGAEETSNSGEASAATTEGGALGVGSLAPPLQVARFLQGEPVTKFEPNKIYVVEFWATWCGPCVQAMPHISEMQKKYPDVTFIGVNVWEDDDSAAEEFLKKRGGQITYRIARDKIAPGAKAQSGLMATTWLEPAGVNGIPSAFVIDGKGMIAEIGHPMELDAILPKVIDGSWSGATAKKMKAEQEAQAQRQMKAFERIQELSEEDVSEKVLAEIDELSKELPQRAAMAATFAKLQLMASSDEFSEQALVEGKKLVSGEDGNEVQLLNGIAWSLVNPERSKPATKPLLAFALELARKAESKVKEENGAIADTHARALFLTGDTAGAIEKQKRSIELFEKQQVGPQVLKDLNDRLAEYEAAAKKTAE